MENFVVFDTGLSGRRLTSSISVPRGLRQYFRTTSFFAEYDADIEADQSILNIPFLAAVIPFAWLTGCDVSVDKIDKTFVESMDSLREEFKKTFSAAPFNSQIRADTLVENEVGGVELGSRTAMLFSGGVDSTYSLLTNLNLKPRLIMFWGADDHAYPENAEQWEYISSTYSKFAEDLGLRFHLVKTNVSQIFDYPGIEHNFHKLLYNGKLRFRIQQSLMLLSLVAPFSMGRFDHLLLAATGYPRPREIPSASRPGIDEKIRWADLKVKNDGYIPRHEKIFGPIRENHREKNLRLKVCLRKLKSAVLNDSSCEKCYRNIVILVLAGIDPNDCGFNVDDTTFKKMKQVITDKQINVYHTNDWFVTQKLIPNNIEYDLHGSKKFLEWFREFDIKSYEPDREKLSSYRDLYYKLPYPISNILDKLYREMGINISHL